MADKLLTTIPGDIPGLLQRGAPVLVTIDSSQQPVRGFIVEPVIELDEPDARCLVWSERNGRDNKAAMFVSLDLTDPTGRVHAAWWVRGWISSRGGWAGLTTATLDLLVAVCDGHPMTSAQIDALARLVLRLAGRGA